MAVHGGTDAATRNDARRRLREREVNVLCTCDLYNEGVDLPFVDTLLFLRPTSSATVFLQQLGRGLRLADRKTSCLVLDFIGLHRADFRFDEVLAALTNVPRTKLADAVEQGFPYLPSGCVLDLDAVARQRVLASIKSALPNVERLAREVREAADGNPEITLRDFLRASGRELGDVYRGDNGWTTLLARAGLRDPVDEETADMSRRLGMLVHVDERARLRAWQAAARGDETQLGSEMYRRRMTMLKYQTHHRGVLREPVDTIRYIAGNAAIRSENRAARRRAGRWGRRGAGGVPGTGVAARAASALLTARDRRRHRIRAGGPQGEDSAGRHPQARRRAPRASLRDLGQDGQELLAEHAVPGLRDQPDAVPLGDAVDGNADERGGEAVSREPRERMAVLSFCTGVDRVGGGVRVPRGGEVEGEQRRAADGDHVGTRGGDAGEVGGEVCDAGSGVRSGVSRRYSSGVLPANGRPTASPPPVRVAGAEERDVAAAIIGYIRQLALSEPVLP